MILPIFLEKEAARAKRRQSREDIKWRGIMNFNVKIGSKPEKTVIAATAAVVLAIFFDGQKKKIKHPEKYKNFPKRVASNYKLIDAALKKTVAKDLYKKTKEHYKSPVLENLEIENGEFIDI